MLLSDFEGELAWIQDFFRGLESMGIELPSGDYASIHRLLDEMRGKAEE